ncbi:MAG: hypothetical protein ACPGRW_08130 [Flavobacteriaceae bacterium]
MGLLVHEAAIMCDIISKVEFKTKEPTVLCLGEPLLYFSWVTLHQKCQKLDLFFPKGVDITSKETVKAKDFFAALGFTSYLSLDYDDYEGATVVHNLNDNNLNPKYYEIADLIYDSGTFEHLFNLPHAFEVVYQLLRKNGYIIHGNPTNGYLDHGFVQISPTLYYDYYSYNKYKIVAGMLLDRSKMGHTHCTSYLYDIYRTKGIRYIEKYFRFSSLLFCVQKCAHSSYDNIPIQSFYSEMHSSFKQEYQLQLQYHFDDFSVRQFLASLLPKNIKHKLRKVLDFGNNT